MPARLSTYLHLDISYGYEPVAELVLSDNGTLDILAGE